MDDTDETWIRWATEVCQDFKIPFDAHTIGLRFAITQWMIDNNSKNYQAKMAVALGYLNAGRVHLAKRVLEGATKSSCTVDGPTAAEADEILGKTHYTRHP